MSRKKKSSKAKLEPPGPAPKTNEPDKPLKLEVVLKQARAGQQAGIFVLGRKEANIDDEVECFETAEVQISSPWQSTCGIFNRG